MMGTRLIVTAGITALAIAPMASAHVGVLPSTAVNGQKTEFTVRAPSEGGLTTTSVRVDFPSQVSVYAVADAPGWTSLLIKYPDGRLRGVQWSGGSIAPGHYVNFTVLGIPREVGQSVWPARQGTAEGPVTRWTGPPETPGATPVETGPNTPGPAAAVTITATAAEAAPPGDSGGGLWLGVIAIAASLVALAGVGYVWSSRPRDLPPDGPEDQT